MIKVEIIEGASIEVEIIGEVTHVTSSDIEHYEGDYVVTPRVSEQVLQTADKLLSGDIKVKATPYYEVTNTDGTTVIIGS